MSIYDVLKRDEVLNYINNKPIYEKRSKEELKNQAIKYIEDLETNLNNSFYRSFYYPIKILFRKINRIVYNNKNLEEVLTINNNIVYASNHKSWLDVLLLPFVLLTEQRKIFRNYDKIKNPRSIAGTNITNSIVGSILKNGLGSISIDRQNKDILYLLIQKNYLSYLLENDQDIIVYPEGGRSYSGEIKEPKLMWLKSVLQSKNKDKIVILPISINYDLVLEDKILTKIGKKVKQKNFNREFPGLFIEGINYKSEFYVNFTKPIYLRDYKEKDSMIINNLIHNQIVQNRIITPTNITAKALTDLADVEDKKISFEKLEEKILYYYKLLKEKGHNIKDKDYKQMLFTGLKRLKGRAINIKKRFVSVKNPDLVKYYSNFI